ncbi:restriction endonuclease subunit S [Geobacillus stearothermophilus]|uniref:restriction endonuclease subunit S n=1 Tax=Geobacillus stearothermophilus TaxID=1422 RepID=UPI003D218D0E
MVEERKIPEGYKMTEVGVIPEDWEVVRLNQVLKVRHGKSQHNVENANGKYPILATGGQIGWATEFLYDRPSVLIGRKGTIDKPQYIEKPFWTIDTLFYTEIGENVLPKYLYYFFNTIDWYSYNEASGVPSLNAKTIEKIYMPLPSIPEQQAIVEALSDVDNLITSIEKLIDKKQKIKQGTMQELLTGKRRLPGFVGEWKVKKIGEIAEIGRGRVISHKEISASLEHKYPVYSSQTSNNGIMGYIDTYDFEGEYITWTTDGVNAGKVFYRNGRFNCTNVCGTIKLKKDDHRFVALMLDTVTPKYVSKNLANPKLMNDVMKQIEIKLPNLEEQQAIAEILIDMDAEIKSLEQKLDKYKSIKQGMMQGLLTGRTRLV